MEDKSLSTIRKEAQHTVQLVQNTATRWRSLPFLFVGVSFHHLMCMNCVSLCMCESRNWMREKLKTIVYKMKTLVWERWVFLYFFSFYLTYELVVGAHLIWFNTHLIFFLITIINKLHSYNLILWSHIEFIFNSLYD